MSNDSTFRNEPNITVNGFQLSVGEAMTVRVAISNLFHEMKKPGALGDDEVGVDIANGYARCAASVISKLHSNQNP